MFILIEAVPQIIESFFLQFTNWDFLLLMIIVFLLVDQQYRRAESVRAAMFNTKPRRIWKDSIYAVILGLAGGLVGSILSILTGLPLSGSGNVFILVLFLAVVLMLINPRFICFAYAGGIISLSNIIFGFPVVNVYQILALVALLHLVESLLIYFSGHLGAVPTFFRNGSGSVAGGFTLQKFWPIPLVVLVTLGYPDAQGFVGSMPDWWPLIKPGVDYAPAGFALVSVVAGLGYGDLAVARSPYEKRKISALLLLLYSVILFILAVVAQHYYSLIWLAAIFSPAGHELVIYIGRRIELAGKPLYLPSEYGAKILDVMPGFAAWAAGLRSGDVIISMGNEQVLNHWDLKNVLENHSCPLEIEYLHGRGQVYLRELIDCPGGFEKLGLLLVSQISEKSYIDINSPGLLSGILTSIWRKTKR